METEQSTRQDASHPISLASHRQLNDSYRALRPEKAPARPAWSVEPCNEILSVITLVEASSKARFGIFTCAMSWAIFARRSYLGKPGVISAYLFLQMTAIRGHSSLEQLSRGILRLLKFRRLGCYTVDDRERRSRGRTEVGFSGVQAPDPKYRNILPMHDEQLSTRPFAVTICLWSM